MSELWFESGNEDRLYKSSLTRKLAHFLGFDVLRRSWRKWGANFAPSVFGSQPKGKL
jgi:hypothetical protein